jgi:ATP-dependent Lon protease
MKRSFLKYSQNDSNNDKDFSDNEETFKSSKKLSYDEHKTKYSEINKEILQREINMNHIFELDLPMDEYIWFMEHIRILKEMDPNTEERYRVKNMIYQRYINLKDVDFVKLNKIKTDSGVECDIVSKILNSDHPDSVKAILYRKYKRCYDNTHGGGASDEIFKIIEWVDNVLDLPTRIKNVSKSTTHDKLIKLWKSLNNNISGLTHIKEKVMETMCAKLLDPENKGKILTLVGPPGVGKTAVAMSIAESLEIPFDQISFGSVKDSVVLTGHSSTYIGAIPGLFTKILLKSKRLDTLVLLDEIDKIPDTPEGKSISSVLLHVLDRTQNHRFRDMYMPEIVLDLSKMIFLSAANSLETIDPVLMDRMTIIEITGYSLGEKIEIVNKHLFPRIKKELGFSDLDLTITDEELEYLIINKTENQSGMREIERKIYQLCERLSLLKHAKGITFSYKLNNVKFPYKIDINTINKLL